MTTHEPTAHGMPDAPGTGSSERQETGALPPLTRADSRSLLDVLAQARHDRAHYAHQFGPDDRACRYDIETLLAALAPADREALEVGLLLADIEARWPEDRWTVGRSHLSAPENRYMAWSNEHKLTYWGSTLHGALTALLAQREPVE